MADVNEVAEDALRHQRLLEITSEGIWEIDARSCTRFVNARMAEMLGYTVAEMAGASLFDFMDEQGKAIAADAVRRREQGIRERHDFKFRRKDGRDLWAIVSADPIFDSTGTYDGAFAVITDITERKEVEAVVRAFGLGLTAVGPAFFQALVRELGKALGVRYAFVARVLPGEPERARTVAFWVDGRVADSFEYILAGTPCARVASQGLRHFPADIQQQFPDDRLLRDMGAESYLGAPLLAANGQALGVLAVVHDRALALPQVAVGLFEMVTTRAAAELERLATDELVRTFSSAIETAEEGIMITDADGVIEVVNPGFERLTGYTAAEVRGLTPRVLKSDRHPPAFYKQIWKRLRSGQPVRVEFTNRHKSGALFEEEQTITPVRDVRGAITHFVAVGRNITDRKRTETRIRKFSQEIIAAREEERRQASSSLHHDLGSLVIGVSAHLDAVHADLGSGNLAGARSWLKRSRKIFDQSVSRLKRLAVSLRPPELDVVGLPAALRQYCAQVNGHGGARVRFKQARAGRRVSDRAATTLFRVAQEALTNAVTHGRARRIEVSLSASQRGVRMTVRDDGKGFKPLGVGHTGRHMGLRVMNEMVASAGGVLAIDSGPRKGTTVSVSLPHEASRSTRRGAKRSTRGGA